MTAYHAILVMMLVISEEGIKGKRAPSVFFILFLGLFLPTGPWCKINQQIASMTWRNWNVTKNDPKWPTFCQFCHVAKVVFYCRTQLPWSGPWLHAFLNSRETFDAFDTGLSMVSTEAPEISDAVCWRDAAHECIMTILIIFKKSHLSHLAAEFSFPTHITWDLALNPKLSHKTALVNESSGSQDPRDPNWVPRRTSMTILPQHAEAFVVGW